MFIAKERNAPSATKIAELFDQFLQDKKHFMVVELSCLTFISSAVVGVLMGCKRRFLEKNGNLVLVGVSAQLKTKLSLMGADKIFNFYSTIRSAISHFEWEYEKREEITHISFPADLRYVPAIRRFVSQIAMQKGYTRRDCFRIEAIADEICNNAVEHGLNTAPESQVSLRSVIAPDKIDIYVENKTNKEKVKEIEKSIEAANNQVNLNNQSRGRGLSLVKKLSKDLEFEIGEKGTTVHVTKLRED